MNEEKSQKRFKIAIPKRQVMKRKDRKGKKLFLYTFLPQKGKIISFPILQIIHLLISLVSVA